MKDFGPTHQYCQYFFPDLLHYLLLVCVVPKHTVSPMLLLSPSSQWLAGLTKQDGWVLAILTFRVDPAHMEEESHCPPPTPATTGSEPADEGIGPTRSIGRPETPAPTFLWKLPSLQTADCLLTCFSSIVDESSTNSSSSWLSWSQQ